MTVYDKIVVSARELAIDLSPVSAFNGSSEQGLTVSVSDAGIAINGDLYTFEDLPKIYNFIGKLKEKVSDIVITTPELYLPLEPTTNLQHISKTDTKEPVNFILNNFFSEETINKVLYNYFEHYYYFGYVENDSTEEITSEVSNYDFVDIKRIVLWTAFYLIEEKRKAIYSSPAYKDKYGNSDDAFINTDKRIRTTVGDSFTVDESPKEDGMDADGFTSLWGDKESFLVKTQLYIRREYELLFKDYSLRDNSGVSIYTPSSKIWRPYTHDNNTELSDVTKAILQTSGVATEHDNYKNP